MYFKIHNSIRVIRATMGHRREEGVIMRLRLGQCIRNSSLKPMGKHHTSAHKSGLGLFLFFKGYHLGACVGVDYFLVHTPQQRWAAIYLLPDTSHCKTRRKFCVDKKVEGVYHHKNNTFLCE